jgi:hypothetical protein
MTNPRQQEEDSRYAAVRQYSLAQILAVWAAAALPMAFLRGSLLPYSGSYSRAMNHSLRPWCSASPRGSSGSSF